MGLREVYKTDGGGSKTPARIAGAIGVIVVLSGFLLWARADSNDSKNKSATVPFGVATLPPVASTRLDAELERSDGGTPEATLTHDEGGSWVDYSSVPIPPEKYEVVYPPSASGLTDDVRLKAAAAAKALVTAQVVGTGREQFPQYFGGFSDPRLPLATGFVVDFSTAMAVPSNPNLVRTIVLWHGVGPGNKIIRQTQIANYFELGRDGALLPVKIDNVPDDIKRSDTYLSGITIN